MGHYVSVRSETGRLKRVMLHRPGMEMEHFVPRQMEEMLFDDIPWVERMREEHDAFAAVLRREGAEVVYIEDFLRDVFSVPEVAEKFVEDLIHQEVRRDRQQSRRFKEVFLTSRPEVMTTYAICGIYPREVESNKESLADYLPMDRSHLIHPLPNFYFARDCAAAVGTAMVPCCMNTEARRREAVLMNLVLNNHPCFTGTMLLYNTDRYQMPIEGGDILVLSDKVVALGCSQRTSIHAVEYVARQILNLHTGFERVMAVHLPPERAFMHLDTVMTMVDPETFVIYPRVIDACAVVEIKRHPTQTDCLAYKRHDSLRAALSSALAIGDVRMIMSGGGDSRTAAREQWNDATNTLCVAPGKVVVYNRNAATNRKLRESGIETIEIEGSELVRGRGGPRCMSMPLLREER
jgi:arginine deiminase